MLTDTELAAIEARANAAAPGEWEASRHARNMHQISDVTGIIADISTWKTGMAGDDKETTANADFIAHARTDVPALVKELRELRAWAATVTHADGCAAEFECDPLCDCHIARKPKC